MEQLSVLNILAQTATGHNVSPQRVSMNHLLNEDSLEKMMNGFWHHMWNKFSIFRNTVAEIIGIMLVIRILKGYPIPSSRESYFIPSTVGL